nr:vWA domain-containing protein [Ktedonobacteraceae bacterium]
MNANSADQFAQTEQEKEPMLLLDTTGSMNYRTAENDATPRRETIHEAISIIVARLAAADSQAAKEEGGGGLRTITFADGRANDIGDLNPNNLQQKWSQIRWAGGTRIMPGFNLLLKAYTDEFGSEPPAERPLLLALVITDGEADDTATFRDMIARSAGSMYVALAIIGYGAEHDRALQAYQQVEAQNAHVKVLPFASETDPEVIASALMRMME